MIHVDPALIAPVPAEAPPAATIGARVLIEGQLAMLTKLAQVGMTIAEECGRQTTATPPTAEPLSGRDPGLTFARVARAVRMTIALQSRLAKDLAALDRAEEQAQASRRTRRRMRLSQLVEQAARDHITARREAGGQYWADEDAVEDEIEQLSAEAYERLIDAEDGGDWLGRPFNEVVAGICTDLGLSPAWTARLLAAAAAPTEGGGDADALSRPAGLAARPPCPDPPPPAPGWAGAGWAGHAFPPRPPP